MSLALLKERTPSVLQVGVTKVNYLTIDKRQKERCINYNDIKMDEEGWVDVKKFIPRAFDILYLRIDGINKIETGWWNGKGWSGIRIEDDCKVLKWKRRPNDI